MTKVPHEAPGDQLSLTSSSSMANGYGNNYVTVYSSRAHVFQINPLTKNSWLPKCDSAIPISFVTTLNDSSEVQTSRRELKIIGTDENGDTVLDCVILPKTLFTKRSQKFGQWIDHTGMVYGLGFNSEAELNEFVETFQQLQRNILSPNSTVSSQSQQTTEQQGDRSSGWSKSQEQLSNFSETDGRDFSSAPKGADMSAQYSNTMAHPGHQQVRRQQGTLQTNEQDTSLNNSGINDNGVGPRYPRAQSMFGLPTRSNNSSLAGRATPETEREGSSMSQNEWQIREQLKQATYENERLKQALEESSKNAGVWHNELLNLRTNNVKLTQALQESKAHVEEWERELLSLRDENKELKLRVMTLESANDPERGNDSKLDLQKYKNYVGEIQSELRRKENEIEDLQKAMEQMELKVSKSSAQNGQMDDGIVADKVISSHQKQKFDLINAKLEAKINELANVRKEFAQLVDKLYH